MKRFTPFPFILLLSLALLLSSCSKKGSNVTPQPALSISSINKSSGPYNALITITGTGFSAIPTDDKVFFNGKAATIFTATATQLITFVPLAAGTGNITVSVKNGTPVSGPVFTYKISWVITSFVGGLVSGSSDGSGTAAEFFQPLGITTDASGNIYVVDQGNYLIRKITPGGVVSTLAGSGHIGHADGLGTAASFSMPSCIAVDASGNVYVTDTGNELIRKITPAGLVTTLAGNGSPQLTDGTGTAASFSNPIGLAIDGSGNLFVADQGSGHIRKVTPSGVVTTVYNGAGSVGIYQLTMDKTGNIYATDYSGNVINKFTQNGVASVFAGGSSGIIGGDIDGTGQAASFYTPTAITIDGNGNLFVIDSGNIAIREITPGAVVSTPIGFGYGGPFGLAFNGAQGITVDNSNNIYLTSGGQILKVSMQ